MQVEQIYKKVTQIEHILIRPDTYIGSIQNVDQDMWIWEDGMKYQQVSYCQGLYKIFDEILVNAADNFHRDKSTNRISVQIGDQIIVENTGKGIPIVIHKEHKLYVPELIFGHLLTSSNFDDSISKVTGGRNGYGAKLANIFSKYFKLETVDKGKKFTMVWENNMAKHSDAEIIPYTGQSFTRITFEPDLTKFHKNSFIDMIPLMQRRVYDLAGILPIEVQLNGKKIKLSSFKQYSEQYGPTKMVSTTQNKEFQWQVVVGASDGQFQQVSFVNAINTIRGGTHVTHVVDQIVDGIMVEVKKKNKDIKVIKPFQVRNYIKIFINCQIVNPSFDSQTKETLTTKPSQFGSKFELTDKFLQEIIKNTDIVESVQASMKTKINKQLQKQLSAKKQERILGIDKLEDANEAGTKTADMCTLILTEGDSAKSLAMAGLEVVGRDRYGVFPLKGKLLNVRDATFAQIMKNTEIANLVKILGLQINKNYENTKSLRYGSIMIMTDQDHDGHHIKGLIINLIDQFWPSLLKIKGFLKSFVTPIIKIKSKRSKENETKSFFSIRDYQVYMQKHDDSDYIIKYYKGLGTSTDQEAQQYFSNLSSHRKTFTYLNNEDNETIDLAFSKLKADQRKEWLTKYTWDNIQDTLDYTKETVRYKEFINECLAMHSISDNIRSIPSAVDGLKPTQRKILFTLLNNSIQEYKVSSLSGLTTTYAQYHHGEQSLQQTIIGMAQNFTGSNNINLLQPIGQFGTRAVGGEDAAQARYISTKLSPIAKLIFNEHDSHSLEYIEEEGQRVEPKCYIPIIPMVLVNGAQGIGTGWSSNVPMFNPSEICDQLKKRMKGESFDNIYPWYKGFIGDISCQNQNYLMKGSMIVHKNTVFILEIPVKKTIKEVQQFIQSKMEGDEPDILDLKEYHAGNKVCFKVTMSEALMNQDLEKYFKISANMGLTNLVLFNKDGFLQKYENLPEIMEHFYNLRLEFYEKRKQYLISKYENEFELISHKVKFIEGMINNTIQIRGLKKADMCKQLSKSGFKGINQMKQIISTKIKQRLEEIDDEKQYDYLMSMNFWNFSQEKVQQMKAQQSELQIEINKLKLKSAQQLWIEDLDEFQLKLKELEEIEIEEHYKRLSKNADKIMKGGSKYLRRNNINAMEEEDYDSDSQQDSANIPENVLIKVITQFGQLGLSYFDRGVAKEYLKPVNQIKQQTETKVVQKKRPVDQEEENNQIPNVKNTKKTVKKQVNKKQKVIQSQESLLESEPVQVRTTRNKQNFQEESNEQVKLIKYDSPLESEKKELFDLKMEDIPIKVEIEPIAPQLSSLDLLYKKYGLDKYIQYAQPQLRIPQQNQQEDVIVQRNNTYEMLEDLSNDYEVRIIHK